MQSMAHIILNCSTRLSRWISRLLDHHQEKAVVAEEVDHPQRGEQEPGAAAQAIEKS